MKKNVNFFYDKKYHSKYVEPRQLISLWLPNPAQDVRTIFVDKEISKRCLILHINCLWLGLQDVIEKLYYAMPCHNIKMGTKIEWREYTQIQKSIRVNKLLQE